MGAVHFLQARKELGGGNGDERSAVAEENREQAERHAGKHRKHQKRKASDDAWKNQREEHEATKQRLAGKVGAVEGEGGEQTQREGQQDAAGGHNQTVEDRIPDGRVSEELCIPIQSEVARRKAANAVAIEGIKDEHHDRQINEAENKRGIESKERRAAR